MTTPTTVNIRLQLRADTAANWTAANPTLLANEVGLETDTKKLKVGDGTTAWGSLAYFPSIVTGGTVLGNLEIGSTGTLTFEGSTANDFETTLGVVDPTADRTINLPNVSGTIITTGDTGTVTSAMIADGAIVDADISGTAEISVSKLADGTARQLLQTDAAGTGVEWTSNVDVPGTLDVTSDATFDSNVTIAGNLTVNGTTTTINTQDLLVEDKNIIIGNVTTPDDTTANAGGITLKGATDKTINWYDATDAWTSSERFSVPLGSAASPSLTFTGDENTGLYSPGPDQLALSTSGVQRINIEADGDINIDSGGVFYDATNNRLAIGTTSPSVILETVQSGITAGTATAGFSAKAEATDGNTTTFRVDLTPSSSSSLVSLVARSAGTGNTSAMNFVTRISGTEAERMRIDSSGRLLVGTSTARNNFFNSSNSSTLQLEGINDGLGYGRISTVYNDNSSASGAIILGKTRGSSVGAVTVVNDGDALGTLSFQGADGTELVEAARIRAEVDGTPGANDMPGRLVFSTTADGASSPTERLRISATGAITTPSTSTAAHSFGVNREGNILSCTNAFSPNPYGIGIGFSSASPNDTTRYFLNCFDSTATRATIRSNGGLANYQSNNVDLSDERTKRDITPVSATWGCVQAWNIVNYNYIDDKVTESARIGVIAQQIQQHCPEVVIPYQEAEDAVLDEDGNIVTPAKEERLGVREQQMMWMAIKALQEAQVRIEALEAEVAALKA